jgi:undecaprenyl-diphosphatase
MDFLQPIDDGTLYWFQNHHLPWLDQVMILLSWIGDTVCMTWFTIAVVLIFAIARQGRSALVIAATGLFGLFLTETIKPLTNRPRPDVTHKLVERPLSKSFPSGHSLNSMAIFGVISLVIARRLHSRPLRVLVVILGVSLSLAIGTSRMYVGVHWLTDVLGGWTAGLACALLGFWFELRGAPTAPTPAAQS